MEGGITKDDLRQFGLLLLHEIKNMLANAATQDVDTGEKIEATNEWVKGHRVRKMLDISPKSLQNLRIEGKVRFRKVLGSYYYNLEDIKSLFIC